MPGLHCEKRKYVPLHGIFPHPAGHRQRLLKKLDPPAHMSPNAMLEALNLLYSLEELEKGVDRVER